MLFAIDFAVTAAVYCAVCLIIYLWKDIPFSIPHLLLEAVFTAASYTLFSALFGVNSVIWRYSSEKDYMHIFCVSVLSGIFALALSILALHVYISHLYSFFALVLCACGVTFSRIFYRLIMMNRDAGYAANAKRLLIVGAGNAGSRMLDELMLARECPLLPVGFIDDDYEKIGRKIGGIPVLGTVADIQSVCENNAIDLIYIAIPSIKKRTPLADFKRMSQDLVRGEDPPDSPRDRKPEKPHGKSPRHHSGGASRTRARQNRG